MMMRLQPRSAARRVVASTTSSIATLRYHCHHCHHESSSSSQLVSSFTQRRRSYRCMTSNTTTKQHLAEEEEGATTFISATTSASAKSSVTSTSTDTTTTTPLCETKHPRRYHRHVAHIRNFLPHGPIPYEIGWAWQHVLLNRRLDYLRSLQQQQQHHRHHHHQQQHPPHASDNNIHNNNNNKDWILLLEHQPVYTLGRGASVEHLTFLRKNQHHHHHDNDIGDDDAIIEEYRRRLDRTYRGKDASRLTICSSSSSSSSKFSSSSSGSGGSGGSSIESIQRNGNHNNTTTSVEEEVHHHLRQLLPPTSSSTPPVLAPNGAPIYRIERGGEVTYHGPGQLVLYPMLHLQQQQQQQHSTYQPDLHWYLRQVEEVIIQTLNHYDIHSHRDSINTGVWVGKNKIAAVGVSSSRWITSHGAALNVSPDLSYFGREIITPCGIDEAEGRGVTSIAAEIMKGRQHRGHHHCQHNINTMGVDSEDDDELDCPTVEEVAEVALKCFAKVFDIDLVPWVDEGDHNSAR